MSSKATAIAVFDISSSSVGGAHALIQKNPLPRNAAEGQIPTTKVSLLVQDRRDTGLEEELNIEHFVNDTARSLEAVIDHVRNGDVHHPDVIQVVLASPWYSTHIRTISLNKTTTFTCTKRLVEMLVEKEIAFLLKQELENGEAFGKGFTVVEQQLSNIMLNGYATGDPYGKKTQSIELVLTITVVPETVVERFKSILRRSYGDRTINVTTGPYATYVALRDNGGVPPDCLIIDVGEEVTDIAFVKNNIFLYQHSFPVGTYELYRAIGKGSGTNVESRAMLEAYRLGKLTPSKTILMKKHLHSFSKVWQRALQEVVESGHYGFQFPDTCYIMGDARFAEFFTALISTDEFLRHGASVDTINAIFVDPMSTTATITTTSGEAPDPALSVAALFSERLLYY
ncbi:MAG: hypothetical protein JWM92_52 [Candidatus Nomurabacteria bacterium]|jgi:hypothetical protein|nr:hypothetical protein [Candidatus Nomurabacteria bacterium]